MKSTFFIIMLLLAIIAALLTTHSGVAGDGREKSVAPLVKDNPLSNLWSGFYYAKSETKAMQLDDLKNPGLLYVEEARRCFSRRLVRQIKPAPVAMVTRRWPSRK